MGKGSARHVIAKLDLGWPHAAAIKQSFALLQESTEGRCAELYLNSERMAWFTLDELRTFHEQLGEWIAIRNKDDAGRHAFSVSIYALYEGRVLLVDHKKQQAIVPIGGEREAGETPLQAAKREILEELGWEEHRDYEFHKWDQDGDDVPPGTPPGFVTYEEHNAGPKGTHMNFAFVIDAKHQNILTKCDEFKSSLWVDDIVEAQSMGTVPPNVRWFVEVLAGTY